MKLSKVKVQSVLLLVQVLLYFMVSGLTFPVNFSFIGMLFILISRRVSLLCTVLSFFLLGGSLLRVEYSSKFRGIWLVLSLMGISSGVLVYVFTLFIS